MPRLLDMWVVLQALYLFAPLLVSAAVSALVLRFDWLRFLAKPIDGGASWKGKRVLGDGKTWRGVAVAVGTSIAVVALQRRIVAPGLEVIDYRAESPVLVGGALGLGAMLGELPNSFVKRRIGIPRGKTARGPLAIVFWLWDQLDLLTTTWPLLAFFFHPTVAIVVASVAIALVLHPAIAWIGYLLGARSSPR
ncbi:MAG: CDP-archaeol synthase [Polyangiales bacterium]